MSRCIIHVGMRKTGTTSIQQSLYRYADREFIYADINGHPNHGGALYSIFARDPSRLGHHRRSKRSASDVRVYTEQAARGLKRSIQEAAGRTMILSGEVCSYLFARDELSRLRDYFLGSFGQVDIVAYIRPPAGYITSNFQQRVKDAAGRIDLQRDYFNYRDNFSKLDDVFGRERVHLWKFDPAAFPGGCVVSDFCARLNIRLPPSRIVRVNESLSREATGLLCTYRRRGKQLGSTDMTGLQNRVLVQRLMKIGSSRFRFSRDVLAPVLEKNRADIEWMEARLGQSLAEDLAEHRPGEVRDDSDLLKTDPKSVEKLLAILGDRAPAGVTGTTPAQVAALVHALREEVSPQAERLESPAAAESHGEPPAPEGGQAGRGLS